MLTAEPTKNDNRMNIFFSFLKRTRFFFQTRRLLPLFCWETNRQFDKLGGVGVGVGLHHKTITHEEIHHHSAAAAGINSSSNLFWFYSSWDLLLLWLHPSDLYPQRVNLISMCLQQVCVCVCLYACARDCIQWTLNCVTTCVFLSPHSWSAIKLLVQGPVSPKSTVR